MAAFCEPALPFGFSLASLWHPLRVFVVAFVCVVFALFCMPFCVLFVVLLCFFGVSQRGVNLLSRMVPIANVDGGTRWVNLHS